jgi:hypothetical protein
MGAGALASEEAAGLLVESFAARPTPACPEELSIVVEREDERELVEAIVQRNSA